MMAVLESLRPPHKLAAIDDLISFYKRVHTVQICRYLVSSGKFNPEFYQRLRDKITKYQLQQSNWV